MPGAECLRILSQWREEEVVSSLLDPASARFSRRPLQNAVDVRSFHQDSLPHGAQRSPFRRLRGESQRRRAPHRQRRQEHLRNIPRSDEVILRYTRARLTTQLFCRQAHIEVCCLYDILSLVHSRRYFNLFANASEMEDGSNINRQQRENQLRQSQDMQKSWMSKRTSARQVSDVLLSSFERFMKIINTTSGNLENFHVHLSNLRQRWKIRKQNNTNRYLGDLSFRSGCAREDGGDSHRIALPSL